MVIRALPKRFRVLFFGLFVDRDFNLDKHFLKLNSTLIFKVLKLIAALFASIWLCKVVVYPAVRAIPHRQNFNFGLHFFFFFLIVSQIVLFNSLN